MRAFKRLFTYACFQAAIHALIQVGIHPSGRQRQWGHDFVQAEFVGKLINRRKVYSTDLRKALAETLALRETADYTGDKLTEKEMARNLRRARGFVEDILNREGT